MKLSEYPNAIMYAEAINDGALNHMQIFPKYALIFSQ